MAQIQTGNNTAGSANVDSYYNLNVTLPLTQSQAGFANSGVQVDPGTLSSTPRYKSLFATDDRRLQVGQSTLLLDYFFNTSAQDTTSWKYVTSTMTTTWNGVNGMLLNASSSLVSGNGTMVSSYRQFTQVETGVLRIDFSIAPTNSGTILANQEFTFGWFPFGAGTAIPTEGVYMRLTSAGLVGVVNYGGSENVYGSNLATAASFTNNTVDFFSIFIYDNIVQFWRNGLMMGQMAVSNTNAQTVLNSCYPISFQCRNTNTVVGTPMQYKVFTAGAQQLDSVLNGLTVPQLQALQGLNAKQGSPGMTIGSTSNITNNIAIGAGAALTNTTALAATLGGIAYVLPTLANTTDGIVFAYQCPAGSTTAPSRTLVIQGITIQGAVTTVLANSAPVVYQYYLAWGTTALNLTTAEGVAAKAARRSFLGLETYAINAAVGTIGGGVKMAFATPIIINPNEFVVLVARNLGTVTTSGVIAINADFDAFWL